MVCRPSAGSGVPVTSPSASSAEIVAPIDCGRTPSARASVVTVAGRRDRVGPTAESWECGEISGARSSRRRRLSLPMVTRSSPASAIARRRRMRSAGGHACVPRRYEGNLLRLPSLFNGYAAHFATFSPSPPDSTPSSVRRCAFLGNPPQSRPACRLIPRRDDRRDDRNRILPVRRAHRADAEGFRSARRAGRTISSRRTES